MVVALKEHLCHRLHWCDADLGAQLELSLKEIVVGWLDMFGGFWSKYFEWTGKYTVEMDDVDSTCFASQTIFKLYTKGYSKHQ